MKRQGKVSVVMILAEFMSDVSSSTHLINDNLQGVHTVGLLPRHPSLRKPLHHAIEIKTAKQLLRRKQRVWEPIALHGSILRNVQ